MSYFVDISKQALKSFENIPETDYIRIKKSVYSEENFVHLCSQGIHKKTSKILY